MAVAVSGNLHLFCHKPAHMSSSWRREYSSARESKISCGKETEQRWHTNIEKGAAKRLDASFCVAGVIVPAAAA